MAKIDINIFGKSIGKVADAITEVTKAISKYLGNADIRRTAKAIRLGDKIVKRIQELGIKDKKLIALANKWDVYNN